MDMLERSTGERSTPALDESWRDPDVSDLLEIGQQVMTDHSLDPRRVQKDAFVRRVVERFGNESRRDRLQGGLLPVEEVADWLDRIVFADLWDRGPKFAAPFAPLRAAAICECAAEMPHLAARYLYRFNVEQSRHVFSSQWELMQRVRPVMPDSTLLTLRRHRGKCRHCHRKAVKFGLNVQVMIGPFVFQTELDAPIL